MFAIPQFHLFNIFHHYLTSPPLPFIAVGPDEHFSWFLFLFCRPPYTILSTLYDYHLNRPAPHPKKNTVPRFALEKNDGNERKEKEPFLGLFLFFFSHEFF